MRVAIACGGTGGHFYPGYALGLELRRRGHEVLFVLRREDPAAARLEADELPYLELDLRGLPRRPSLDLLLFPLRLLRSILCARRALDAWRPAAAVGMGGYLTFPLASAARLLGVPVLLHESNAVLGLANRVLLPLAEALALGLPLREERARTVLTGTPVRAAFATPLGQAEARRRLGLEPAGPLLLAFGGSQGARALNAAVPAALGLLRADGLEPQVLHLAGRGAHAEVERLYAAAGLRRARVLPYLEDMPSAYAAADAVLCRAGAATLAELAASHRPALLVPYPSAAAGHQEENARVLERAGAARVLLEPLVPAVLAGVLRPLLEDAVLRERMSAGYAALALPAPECSAPALADLVERCARKDSR